MEGHLALGVLSHIGAPHVLKAGEMMLVLDGIWWVLGLESHP